jgi:hypothetical protein
VLAKHSEGRVEQVGRDHGFHSSFRSRVLMR